MLKFLLGFRSYDTNETPDVLFIGHDGDELEKSLAEASDEYIRLSKIFGATEIPASRPDIVEQAVEDAFEQIDEASDSVEQAESPEPDAEDLLSEPESEPEQESQQSKTNSKRKGK